MNISGCTSIVICAAFALLRATFALAEHPTTPFQYWSDPCGYPWIPSGHVGDVARMKEATAMLVPKDQLELRSDNPGYYRFKYPEPHLYYPVESVGYPANTVPWGDETPFVGEMRYAERGRTAFLIAPNIVATASHSGYQPGDPRNFNPHNFYVVFDVMKKETSPGLCTEPNSEYIPASNVYTAKPTSQPPLGDALIADTMLEYRDDMNSPLYIDYGAFYIDRAVPANRRYLRIRESGHLADYDRFAILGHPYRLPSKLLIGMTYTGDVSLVNAPEYSSPHFTDFYLADGMSGSAVYNLDRDFVEVVSSGGAGTGCTNVLPPFSIFNPDFDWEMRDGCDEVPHAGEYRSEGVNLGDVTYLAALVPRPYLRVSPLDDVTYILPIGTAPSPAQTIYTAYSSPTETSSTTISAYVATPPSGEPAFLHVGNHAVSLAPGTSTSIAATASVPVDTPCGVYDRYMTVADVSHQFGDKMRHRFEIGMTDFDVTSDDSDLYAVTAPSSPASIAYTVTNTRPTPVTVVASLGQSWLTFDGPSSVTLMPAGQVGSTQTIVVKLFSTAYALSNGDYPFVVTFAGEGGCSMHAPIERTGVFHKGYVRLRRVLDALVFPPTPELDPVTDSFTISASFCVRDIKARFDSQSGGGAGVPWSIWAPSVRIYLDYAGSTALTTTLWNLNELPAGWYVPTQPGPEESVLQTLLLDRYLNVPPTGISNLSMFLNRNASGQWSFRLYDDGLQSVNTGILHSWELEITGSALCFGGA